MKKNFLFGKVWFFEDFKIPTEPQTSTWGFLIEKEIYSGKSKYQKIEIFKTKEFGKILVLDGLVQLATKYEYIYHEMLVHPAFFCHPQPKKILIMGGGDGGALREAVKHRTVKEIFLVDIDRKAIEVSKKYLPSVSQGAFSDKRVKIFIGDASEFVKKYKNYFDIIICDSTDPTGPSFVLWQSKFYRNIKKALNKGGIAGFQTADLKEKFAKRARDKLKKIFPFLKIHKAFIDCFPLDEHTFSFGSERINFDKVDFKKIKERYKKEKIKTKYYSPKIHFASAILPKYVNYK